MFPLPAISNRRRQTKIHEGVWYFHPCCAVLFIRRRTLFPHLLDSWFAVFNAKSHNHKRKHQIRAANYNPNWRAQLEKHRVRGQDPI